jgi:hypothetical protein
VRSDLLKGSTSPGENRTCRSAAALIAINHSSRTTSLNQTVCSLAARCQRQRSTVQRRAKLATDPQNAQVVRDSQKKWTDADPDYQKSYRHTRPEAVERIAVSSAARL